MTTNNPYSDRSAYPLADTLLSDHVIAVFGEQGNAAIDLEQFRTLVQIGLATTQFVTSHVASFMGGSADLLDTLNTLTEQLASDPDGVAGLMALITNTLGGENAHPTFLKLCVANLDAIATERTYNDDDVMIGATLTWHDGSSGTLTTTMNADGVVDGFTATHDLSGQAITQPSVIFTASGLVQTRPPLTLNYV